jgi:hypothetical protein
MKQGFCFGLGMMLGLLTPAVLVLVFVGIYVGLRDWLLNLRKKDREHRFNGSESSRVLLFRSEPGAQQAERTDYSQAGTH